jgi:ATP-dependent exoDNAse (exonuclease V) alpha subunit
MNIEKNLVDLEKLNEDQKEAFEELKDFITDKNDESVYVLKGWAGTGKTFCISILVKFVLEVIHQRNKWYKIAVTGPTNKSVRVIKKASSLRNDRVIFQTIHKLLGLKEKITNDGKQEFVTEGFYVPMINSISLLIIDEVSMLNDELFESIIKHRGRIKIICMGDPAQIPPVGKPDCIPFREELAERYKIKTLNLKTIMRQKKGNPIIESSVEIRKNIGSQNSPVKPVSNILENGEGIEFLNISSADVRSNFTKILEKYFKSEEFENDSEYTKIIAWRNKTVSKMNDLVRRIIYGEESLGSKILKGEKLIANSPLVRGKEVILTTNEEFTVESYDIKEEKHIYPYLDVEETFLKYYNSLVIYYDDDIDKHVKHKIKILHEDSQKDFDNICGKLKQYAVKNSGKNKSWIKYFDFLRSFDDVGYAYSITAHKSQGSTYKYSFVFEDDIDLNLDVIERNRIKYTAYTRASKKLYVVKAIDC